MTNIERSLLIKVKIRRSTFVSYYSLNYVNNLTISLSFNPLDCYVYKLVIGLEKHRISWNKHKTPYFGFLKICFWPTVDPFSRVVVYNVGCLYLSLYITNIKILLA
jgi:hypothetical protein